MKETEAHLLRLHQQHPRADLSTMLHLFLSCFGRAFSYQQAQRDLKCKCSVREGERETALHLEEGLTSLLSAPVPDLREGVKNAKQQKPYLAPPPCGRLGSLARHC